MKKLLVVLILLFVVACSNNESSNDQEVKDDKKEEVVEEKESELTQEELNEQLIAEAIKADFVELNSGEAPEGKKVFIEGIVDVVNINNDEILQKNSVSTVEGDGYGVYDVVNVLDNPINEGDIIKAYGTFSGKDEETGIPKINSTVIEVQEYDKNNETHVKLKELSEDAPTE